MERVREKGSAAGAGRRNGRKNCSVVITLAGSLTASGSGGFRLLTRSR